MSAADEYRSRARATWAAGDWDSFARLIEPVGAAVLDRIALEPGVELLDVGTGSGRNVAIPAAERGAKVVGADITPELLEHARAHAEEAGVEIEWVEADAQELPFEEDRFDRVVSTFGAMFAPDHARAATELVRVCRPGGRVAMTTWVAEGFAGELFKLTGSFMPPPPANVQPPALWGATSHIEDAFGAAGVRPAWTRESVMFEFPSVEDAVRLYAEEFGPFVMARGVLEPQGRWDEFLGAFADLIRRFDPAIPGTAQITSDYYLITIEV